MIEQGQMLYGQHCGRCHGGALMSSGVVPDLRNLSAEKHLIFSNIVLDGVFEDVGMVAFRDVLSEQDARAIQAYVLEAANDRWEADQQPGWWRALVGWVLDLVAAVVVWFLI
jgi:quinohemoprotein ethanol dehydrogenase